MKWTPFFSSSSKLLAVASLSMSLALIGCDERNHRRHAPARRAGGLNKLQPNNQGTPNGLPTGKIPVAGNPAGPNNIPLPDIDPIDSDTNGNPSNQRSGNTAPRPTTDGAATNPLEPRTKTSSTNGTNTRNTPGAQEPDSPAKKAQQPEDPVLEQLQQILTHLHNIYLNAWYTVNKDKSSKPRNFFENVAGKLQNIKPVITINKGENTPTTINDHCDRYRLVHNYDNLKNRHRLFLYDCTTKSYLNSPLIVFSVQGNEWTLATTPQSMEVVLPNELGYLSTIAFKPICTVSTKQEDTSIKVKKAHCSDWGQQLSAARAKDRKTVIFTSITYDSSAPNILETEAQFVDYDGNNQVCRSGKMKRKAPTSSEVIYMDDEDETCRPSPGDQPTLPQPTQPQPPLTEANVPTRPTNSPPPFVNQATGFPANPRARMVRPQSPVSPISNQVETNITPDTPATVPPALPPIHTDPTMTDPNPFNTATEDPTAHAPQGDQNPLEGALNHISVEPLDANATNPAEINE